MRILRLSIFLVYSFDHSDPLLDLVIYFRCPLDQQTRQVRASEVTMDSIPKNRNKEPESSSATQDPLPRGLSDFCPRVSIEIRSRWVISERFVPRVP